MMGSGDNLTAVNPSKSTCNYATQIPTNRLDPVAMYFMKSYPMPNYNSPLNTQCAANSSGNLICNNYLGGLGSSQNPYNISLKVNHEWSPRSKYFGEWLYDPGMYNNFKEGLDRAHHALHRLWREPAGRLQQPDHRFWAHVCFQPHADQRIPGELQPPVHYHLPRDREATPTASRDSLKPRRWWGLP